MDVSSHPARSISMPSRFHHKSLQVVEEALNNMRTQDFSMASTSGSVGSEALQLGVLSLVKLYGYFQELILSPSIRQALLHLCRGKLEEALDESAGLLDMCSTAGNLMLVLKEQVYELQSAIRRKGNVIIENESNVYLSFRRRMAKDVAKFLRGLKQMESKYGLLVALPDLDPRIAMIVRVQREIYAVTINVLRSLFMFLSMPTKGIGWTLISKLLVKGSRASSRSCKISNEVSRVDLALSSDTKLDMQLVQDRLQLLDGSIRCLEGELETLSKHLVKTRVSLLNMLTC